MANSGYVGAPRQLALALTATLTTAAVHAEPVNVIYAAENALYGAGYDIGRADGWIDSTLREAIRQYQSERNGLEPTGNLDINTLFALGISSEAGAPVTGNALPNQKAAMAALGLSPSSPVPASAPVSRQPEPRVAAQQAPEPEPEPEPVVAAPEPQQTAATQAPGPASTRSAPAPEPKPEPAQQPVAQEPERTVVAAAPEPRAPEPSPEPEPEPIAELSSSNDSERQTGEARDTQPEPAADSADDNADDTTSESGIAQESTRQDDESSSGGFFSWLYDFFFGWMF